MRGSGGGERGSYIMADWWRMRIGCFSFHLSLQRKRLSQWGQCHQDRRCFHDNQESPPLVFSWFVLHWDEVFKRWRCWPCTERKWERRGAHAPSTPGSGVVPSLSCRRRTARQIFLLHADVLFRSYQAVPFDRHSACSTSNAVSARKNYSLLRRVRH